MLAPKPASRRRPRLGAAPGDLAPVPPGAELLRWYDRHRRVLPWRAGPGEAPQPYHVWLSEIMLQQTNVTTVTPYFRRFLALFPTVEALAQATEAQVLGNWAGLGYYARARNLHACAREVSRLGGFPADRDALRALPGIGDYTADAIAAIAFGQARIPVDGNVERVASRLFRIEAPLPGTKPQISRAAKSLGQDPDARARPADFAQALFDLGATICTPRAPACALCPWTQPCLARRAGIAASLPARTARPERPRRYGAIFVLSDEQGRVLLRRRPPSGLLGGMSEMPGTEWRETEWSEPEARAAAPIALDWRYAGDVAHVFTHFALTLRVYAGQVDRVPQTLLRTGFLRAGEALADEALPSLMRKCLRAALPR